MKKFIKNSLKVMGAVAILVFATKDTGTIINTLTIKDTKGIEVTFNDGEIVNILNENANTFTVEKGGKYGEIEKDSVLLTQKKSQSYIARRITPLKEDIDSENVKRFVLEGELITVQKNEGSYCFVLTEDNMTGYVLTEDLEKKEIEVVNLAYTKEDAVIGDGSTMPKGTLLKVNSYENGVFKCVNSEGKEINAHKELLDFVKNEPTRGLDTRNEGALDQIITKAKEFLGKPYVYGSSGPNAFDCSGFTSFIYKLMGYKIPRSSVSQSGYGEIVDRNNLKKGDLIFFNTSGSGVSHVGIYIGDNQFIHASSSPINRVIISSLSENYYNKRYVSARRIIK